MNKWRIKFIPKAEKRLNKLSPDAQIFISDYLYNQVLRLEHPKLLGKALKGNKKGLWRYRVNKFRIVCKLEENQLIILVLTVAKRDVVYED
ncbi:type II toxin-antitoxin system RelE/ParE family toxin [Megaira polyxenophila phage MAnkyphage_25.80]|nr:type II toxin-antitoxin system RelE/ParE family toxin [Megaira polyxenophila phage MAnkyphage_25.80]